jgi:tetratricopeptide (TPR) repeat protein
VVSLNNLQSLYYRQGRYGEAEPIALEVLERTKRRRGETHPLTIQAEHNLATIYARMGKYSDAERLFLTAIDEYRRVLGEDHPETCGSLRRLAEMYQSQSGFRRPKQRLCARIADTPGRSVRTIPERSR